MAMIVFCDHCRKEKGWRKPAMRVTNDPCDFCGGHDVVRKAMRNGRTNEPIIDPVTNKIKTKTIDLKNFEHDEQFLVGTRAETRLQEPLA